MHIDWQIEGVGGNDSWSGNGQPLAKYTLPGNKAYAYAFTLQPVSKR